VTLRVGTQLVGLRADTDTTLSRLRTLLASWIDDDHPHVPWIFDVRLGPEGDQQITDRGPRPVPQIRLGQLVIARSRDADDAIRALASILGGVLARQDQTRLWLDLRAFTGNGRVVLVDARPPALAADAVLTRAGISELPIWSASIDGTMVHVPPPLDGLDWVAIGVDPPPAAGHIAQLAGIVAYDPTVRNVGDSGHQGGAPSSLDRNAGAVMLTRFAARNPSTTWFSTVEGLLRDDRVAVSPDRSVVRQRIAEIIDR
jgi:hypothetical protein